MFHIDNIFLIKSFEAGNYPDSKERLKNIKKIVLQYQGLMILLHMFSYTKRVLILKPFKIEV